MKTIKLTMIALFAVLISSIAMASGNDCPFRSGENMQTKDHSTLLPAGFSSTVKTNNAVSSPVKTTK